MIRYTLHVPEQRNDGSLIEPAYFEEIEGALEVLAGGWTLTPGIGGWRGENERYREPVRLYAMDVEQDLNGNLRRALVLQAGRIADELEQEAVYLTRQDIETYFVSPARKEITA